MKKSSLSLILLAVITAAWLFLACIKSPVRYRAVYLDLDGTALDVTGVVRASTVKALQDFKSNGGQVGIATGRNRQQASEAIAAIQPSLPSIIMNGVAIIDPKSNKQQILARLDPESMRIFLSKYAGSSKIKASLLYFAEATAADRDSSQFALMLSDAKLAPTFYSHLSKFSADSLLKIIVFCKSETIEPLRIELASSLPKAQVISSTPTILEIIPPAISKMNAIEQVSRDRHISLSEIIAFGDGRNDLEMIKGVGIGVAMSNAHSEVQAASDLIIGSNSTDAIARAINFLTKR